MSGNTRMKTNKSGSSRPTRRSVLKWSAGMALATGAPSIARAANYSVNVALSFLPMGRFAPFYLALDDGSYRDAGLDVTLSSVAGPTVAFQMLAGGSAQICTGDIPTMMLARGKEAGLKVRSVAVTYDKHPMTCFYFKNKGIKEPKDLEGRTIIDGPGSVGRQLFPLFAKANNVDASKVNWKITAVAAKTGVFLSGSDDAVMTYILTEPSISAGLQPGQELGWFVYGEHGVDLYGDGIIARQEFLDSEPERAKAFVQTTMAAFDAAFRDPEKAVAAMEKHVPTLDRSQALKEIAIVESLARNPANPLGFHQAEKMQTSYDAVVSLLGQPLEGQVSDYYTNDFL